MGGHFYSSVNRSSRTELYSKKDASGRHVVTTDQIFEQNKHRTAHESMLPSGDKAGLRESRDSEIHPNSVPIVIVLDITASMGDIPEHFIREGIPKIIEKIMERGVKDPQVMFMAVGDSKCDNHNGVFQIGQFESGDEQIDLWLKRVWLAGGGGGNGGESYYWPYYYAKHHVVTDAWEKRKQKGFIFTIGDDHCFSSIHRNEIEAVMGKNAKITEDMDVPSLVEDIKERWNIYHLDLGNNCLDSWTRLLGKECVLGMGRANYEAMGDKIVEIVTSYTKIMQSSTPESEQKSEEQIGKKTDNPIIL